MGDLMWGDWEHRERIGRQSFTLVFDAVPDDQIAPIREGKISAGQMGEYFNELRPVAIDVKVDPGQSGYEVAKSLEPSLWYPLPQSDGNVPSRVWGLGGDEREPTNSSVRFDSDTLASDSELNSAMTLTKVATAANRQSFLRESDGPVRVAATAVSLAIFDVGQGSCAALCDDKGEVVAYLDYGGGWGPNARTFPAPLCWHPGSQPPVLLSHWDLDHLVGFERRPEVLNSEWLAPAWAGALGPRHLKLAAALGSKLTLVSSTAPSLASGLPLSVEAGLGDNKNDSGLIAQVRLQRSGNDFDVLIPGDCSYQFLPLAMQHQSLDLLVESHHGGNCHLKSSLPPGVPSPKGTGTMAIASRGTPNSYNHPNKTALAKIRAAGWGGGLPTTTATFGTGGFRMAGTTSPTSCGPSCRQQCPMTF